jgi:membrane protease YdiL (CAAX protease family)
MLPFYLNPLSVFRTLDQIDREPPSYTADRASTSRTTLIVLFSTCVALLLLNYAKNSSSMVAALTQIALWQGHAGDYWIAKLDQTGFYDLGRYVWWSGWHVIAYVLIPAFVLRVFFQQRLIDYGWRWGETHKHWRGYLVLLSPILILVVLVSHRDDFVNHYPFYAQASRSWLDFIAWEFLYLLQFACLEFFYRGYMVQTLRPHYGSSAIWIMVVPYLMIHFPKPWLEATGAIFFGLFLGMLALRSRSIWGGFFVHAGVAISMDIASLIQQQRLPQQWLPW